MLFPGIGPEFWAYGAGAMCWRMLVDNDGNQHLGLYVRLPGERGGCVLYPMHQEGNWAHPGNKPGWNGNWQQPTFKPSIVGDNWHGFITHGEISDQTCDCCEILNTDGWQI